MSLIKKVSIVLVCVMVFSFVVPGCVHADEGLGGKLLDPVMSFLVALGDGVMSLIEKTISGVENVFIEIKTTDDRTGWEKFVDFIKEWGAIIIAVIVIIAGIALTLFGPEAVTKTGRNENLNDWIGVVGEGSNLRRSFNRSNTGYLENGH